MSKVTHTTIRAKTRSHLRLVGALLFILLVLAGMLFLSNFSMDVLSGLRAYVEGEGHYSKSQKDAAYHLVYYAHSCDVDLYNEAKQLLEVPLGDRIARMELDKTNGDRSKAREGFLRALNHREDIDNMIDLFLRFRHFDHIDRAIDVWRRGDDLIQKLIQLSQEIHQDCRSGAVNEEKIHHNLKRLSSLNEKLSKAEAEFSATLGEASRWAQGLVFSILLAFAIVAGIICVSLSLFVARIITNTEKFSRDLEKQNWLKSGQTNLNDKIRGELDISALATRAIGFLAEYLQAQMGAFYVTEDNGSLQLQGSYAYTDRKSLSNRFQLGESLVGQAALERKPITLSEVPEDYIPIQSGLGQTRPRHVLVFPVTKGEQVLGVLELARLTRFDDAALELLEQISLALAIALEVVQSRQKLSALLIKTQQQSDDLSEKNAALTAAHRDLQEKTEWLEASQQQLTMQGEELQAANEELEEQTQALRASEEELKEQREELQVANEELEEKTERLTRQKAEIQERNREIELAREELLQKAEELAIASKYKSEFLANMSHELRNPLNSLLILSQSLANNDGGNLTADQIKSAKIIHKSGNDLMTLINDILDLSKVEAGRLNLIVESVSLENIERDLVNQFEPVAKQKGVKLLVKRDADLPSSINTDGKRVEQILRNLLANAFKFTSEGHVKLEFARSAKDTVFQRTQLNEAETLAISITDTGIGISEDKKHEIFEAFRQADGSISRSHGGTGLGLAISKELANLLGGEIQLKSRPDHGSTFTLHLPIEFLPRVTPSSLEKPWAVQIPAGIKRPTTSPEKRNAELTSEQRSSLLPDDRFFLEDGDRTILIIEDDADYAHTLMQLARKKGYKCLVAGTGSGGLKLASEYLPSGIILDIGLPDIDGIKVLDQLKYDLKTRHIPVHVISAMDVQSAAFEKGAVGFLSKPTSLESVDQAFSRIEQLFNKNIKQLLVIEDDEAARAAITSLIENKGISITTADTGRDALEKLSTHEYDCVILDLTLPDMSGFELLKKLESGKGATLPPVIVYTGKELTPEEHKELSVYAASIVIKGANSPERLLDEASLFLHSVDASLSPDQRKIIQVLHDPEKVLEGRRILLVDDDMRNAFALSGFLKKYGVEVIIAENGKVALDLLDNTERVDLILMDIMMPVMDGYQAMRKIRVQPRFSRLPIIAITAKVMPEDRDRCIAAGANDYLAKPIDTERLLSLIRVWLFAEQ